MEKSASNRASCDILFEKLEEELLRRRVLDFQFGGSGKQNNISYDYAIERVI